jgi:DNA-directed RNA polymerase subunit F
MPNPKIIEETAMNLVDLKADLEKIEARDKELNYRSNKSKEYIHHFVDLSMDKKNTLNKKLIDLDMVRLKDAHIIKIIDFLPKDVDELKVILQAYPVTMPKKDMESIIAIVKEFRTK